LKEWIEREDDVEICVRNLEKRREKGEILREFE